jgi:hypothetical protein
MMTRQADADLRKRIDDLYGELLKTKLELMEAKNELERGGVLVAAKHRTRSTVARENVAAESVPTGNGARAP